jgi:hypothetical protein
VSSPDPKRVAAEHLRRKLAGEVIFKKDRGGDANSWAYADHAPSKREIPGDFNYSPKHQKPMATVLRSTLAALGHTLSAHNTFAKLKSARVSPDGNLGGRGYIQKIADMRKQYMNCVEALSALSDTLYDEINAPHWSLFSRQQDAEEQAEVSALLEDAETIRRDPEEWAEEEIAEEFGDDGEIDEDALEDGDVELEYDTDSVASDEDEEEDDEDEEDDSEDDPDGLWDDNGFDDESSGHGKSAKTSARDVRLELRVPRIAYDWLAKNDQSHEDLGEVPASAFEGEDLLSGLEIEMERTDDPEEALEIVMDHLVEDSDYYETLEEIEGEQQ